MYMLLAMRYYLEFSPHRDYYDLVFAVGSKLWICAGLCPDTTH